MIHSLNTNKLPKVSVQVTFCNCMKNSILSKTNFWDKPLYALRSAKEYYIYYSKYTIPHYNTFSSARVARLNTSPIYHGSLSRSTNTYHMCTDYYLVVMCLVPWCHAPSVLLSVDSSRSLYQTIAYILMSLTLTDNVQTMHRGKWTFGPWLATKYRAQSSMGYRVVCCILTRMQQSQLFYKYFICFYIKLLHISTTEDDS